MSNNDNFDYEDMVDGSADEYVEPMDATTQQGTMNGQAQQQEVTPVNLSKGKVCVIVVVFLVLVLLVLIVISGMDVKKKPSANQGTSAQSTEVQNSEVESSQKQSEKVVDDSTKVTENSAVSSEVSSSSSELNNLANNEGVGKEVNGTQTDGTLVQGEVVEQKPDEVVDKAEFELITVEPVLGAEVQVSGMVKGISMYRVGDSYTYGVNLILIIGNDTNVECTYFCPKKTADALSIGTSLAVNYQADSNGNICVVSISR